MKRTSKYLIYMLTVVLIISVIGVAFAWYSSNTTVTATGTATAAKAENVDISFVFQDGDNSEDKLYLAQAQLLSDYYNRTIYSGEEGYSAVLGGMVGNATDVNANGDIHLQDPDFSGGDVTKIGARDHVFTLYYYIEVASSGKEVDFGLSLNSVKIYKNGVTLKNADGEEVGDSKVEYPLAKPASGEGDESAAPELYGDGMIAKVSIGAGALLKEYYFNVTQTKVYHIIDESSGELTDEYAETAAVYSPTEHTLTVNGEAYTLTGHEYGAATDKARYFKTDVEEKNDAETGAEIENFVFNFYDVSAIGADMEAVKAAANGKIYNKAHEGDYKLYTKDADGTEAEFVAPSEKITSSDSGVRLIIAVTHFRKIADGTDAVSAVFPYSAKEFMKSHFKFNISAELAK